MAPRTLPGLGLKGFWDFKEENWHGEDGMDGNLRQISIYAQLSVLSQSLTEPPAAPSEGDTYIVAQGATGDWDTQSGKIAAFDAGDWVFLDAITGLVAYVEDEESFWRYDGGWFPLSEPEGFSAYCNYDQGFWGAGAWRSIPVNNARHNDKVLFDAASNMFVAPSAGLYHFTVSWTYTGSAPEPTTIGAGVKVNGADPEPDTQRFYSGAMVDGLTSVSTQAVLKLAAGDTVEPASWIADNDAAMMANNNQFAGFKIG